jgi:hypothetical protein
MNRGRYAVILLFQKLDTFRFNLDLGTLLAFTRFPSFFLEITFNVNCTPLT